MVAADSSIAPHRQMPRPTGFLGRFRARTLEPLWNAMERVATRGDLATRCAPLRGSELSPLREAFDAMVERLERREAARERYRRELTSTLSSRERELERERQRTRELLAALDQGVIVVDRTGMAIGERSASFDRFFGAPEPGQTVAQVMTRASARFAEELATGWLAIEDGILPLPLVLAKLPRTLVAYDGRCYRFAYHALADCTLVVISEITDTVELRLQENERNQLLGLLERVAADRSSFVRFFEESEALLRQLCADTPGNEADERRALHTLTANLRLFGLEELAALVSTVEAREALGGLSEDDRTLLRETFQRFAERARPLLGIEPGRSEVDQRTLQRLLAAVRTPETPPALRTLAERLPYESVDGKLRQLAESARTRAEQLSREPPRVEIEADHVLAPARLHWFWQVLPHVVHNAVEHGRPRTLWLRARERNDALVVDVEDDGVGIDWSAVRACAERLDLPAETPQQLEAVLFTHGASTVAANDTGRGLGLAAVEAQCRRHGARWELRSTPGQGCSFHFELPHARSEELERRKASVGSP